VTKDFRSRVGENAFRTLADFVFQEHDTDRSGFMESGELRMALEKVQMRPTDAELAEIVKVYDDDDNRRLGEAEWHALLSDLLDGTFDPASKKKGASANMPAAAAGAAAPADFLMANMRGNAAHGQQALLLQVQRENADLKAALAQRDAAMEKLRKDKQAEIDAYGSELAKLRCSIAKLEAETTVRPSPQVAEERKKAAAETRTPEAKPAADEPAAGKPAAEKAKAVQPAAEKAAAPPCPHQDWTQGKVCGDDGRMPIYATVCNVCGCKGEFGAGMSKPQWGTVEGGPWQTAPGTTFHRQNYANQPAAPKGAKQEAKASSPPSSGVATALAPQSDLSDHLPYDWDDGKGGNGRGGIAHGHIANRDAFAARMVQKEQAKASTTAEAEPKGAASQGGKQEAPTMELTGKNMSNMGGSASEVRCPTCGRVEMLSDARLFSGGWGSPPTLPRCDACAPRARPEDLSDADAMKRVKAFDASMKTSICATLPAGQWAKMSWQERLATLEDPALRKASEGEAKAKAKAEAAAEAEGKARAEADAEFIRQERARSAGVKAKPISRPAANSLYCCPDGTPHQAREQMPSCMGNSASTCRKCGQQFMG